MTTIYLIRHGESIYNTMHIVQDDDDDKSNTLSPHGREQAESVAAKLSEVEINQIYCSPLIRAHETAIIISANHGMTPVVYPKLHEKKQAMQGMKETDMLAKYKNWATMSEDERLDIKVTPKEESQREVLARALQTIQDISNKHPDQTIFCITHGGFMRALYTHLAKLSLKDMWHFKNCGYLKIQVEGANVKILETDQLELKSLLP